VKPKAASSKVVVQGALAILLAAQVAYGVAAYARRSSPVGNCTATFVEVGDSLPVLRGSTGGRHEDMRLDDGTKTLLVSLRSTCRWCTEALPQIRSDLERVPSKTRVLVITSEGEDVTRRYAEQAGIRLPVLSFERSESETVERRLASRTPWVFLVDGGGTVRASSHSSDLAHVAVMLGGQ
jgi:hypothetical protein